jgi:hypothetical protein
MCNYYEYFLNGWLLAKSGRMKETGGIIDLALLRSFLEDRSHDLRALENGKHRIHVVIIVVVY